MMTKPRRARTFSTQVRILVRCAKVRREVLHLYMDEDGNVGVMSDPLRKMIEAGNAPHVAKLVECFLLTCRPKVRA